LLPIAAGRLRYYRAPRFRSRERARTKEI